ncbi:MAG TPA: metallopeptidase family protein, partial [Hyphomicrobiales bacterium]|nr:metallopeptidase family protein [Rhodobiaceae bacterium]HXK54867.1 metallopeptidase family protein [Hyphomicrobiales bacterium]
MGSFAPLFDWARMEAPGVEDLERLAHAAYSALPDTFRNLCDGLIIRVADLPDEEVLDDLGLESEFDLLGLFTGIGLAHRGETWTGAMPNMIFLYRRPILDYWAEHEETLGAVVTHVLVHEIGHHFGLSDGDMEAIELAAGP